MSKQIAKQLKALAEMARRDDIAIEIVAAGLLLRTKAAGDMAPRLQLLPFDRFAEMTIDEVIQHAKGDRK